MHSLQKIFPLILLLLLTLSSQAKQDDVVRLRNNIKQVEAVKIKEQGVAKLDAEVGKLLASQNEQASWDGIDLTVTTRTNWSPIRHLNNLRTISQAYSYSGSKYYHSKLALLAVKKGLDTWVQANPRSDNGWQTSIATPKVLGLILVLIDADVELSKNELASLMPFMAARKGGFGKGANLVDTSIHRLYRGAVLGDTTLIAKASAAGFSPVVLTNDLGIQHDYSFLQHGYQLHIASYGIVFINGTVKLMQYLDGTSYQMSDQKKMTLANFVLGTFVPATRGKYIDYNTLGRSISRPNAIYTAGMAASYEKLAELDTARTEEYQNAVLRTRLKPVADAELYPSQNHNYWRADYMQHNRAEFLVTVRASSTRTIKSERLNNENILGYFLTEGATNIQVNGNEYFNIFPIWDWAKIPGVTAPYYKLPIIRRPRWTYGASDFVGGLSEEKYGLFTYLYNEDETTANKTWFFFDEAVVCLGAGISSMAEEPVYTTINQAWLDGAVVYKQNGSTSVMNKSNEEFNDLEWLWHDSIAYVFPHKDLVQVIAQEQTGNWRETSLVQKDTPVKGNVFTLTVNHGVKPIDDSYAYVLLPGLSSPKDVPRKPMKDIDIISNTTSAQVVYDSKADILQSVLYQKGTYELGNTVVKVSSPCALSIVGTEKANPRVYVSDPSQQLKSISIALSIDGGEWKSTQLNLPVFPWAGSTVPVHL